MSVEPPEETFLTQPYHRPRRGGRAILFAGVAGACALGAGLGLWARPAMHERRAAAAPVQEAVDAPPVTMRKLQIVVGDQPPAPLAPIKVLPTGGAPARATALPPPAEPPKALRAPTRPPEGLIRAKALITASPSPHPLITTEVVRAMVPAITHAISATGLAIARAEAPPPARLTAGPAKPVELARAEPPPEPPHKAQSAEVQAAKTHAAKAQAAKAQAAKARLASAAAAKAHAARIELAKAQATKAAAHRLEFAQVAKAKKAAARAEKAEQVRLAEAEARGRAEAREEARQEAQADARKRTRLAALAHTLARALPHRARPEPVEVAAVTHRRGHRANHEARVEQASLKTRRGHEAARLAPARPARAHPQPLAPQSNNGLVKVSTSPRCASRDPGEALVCADPSLSAAERQLSRAYQGARAAGVPDAQLRSQQQRWLAARSAAAREAPWAVRDVYMARIAELNGQARDAQDGY